MKCQTIEQVVQQLTTIIQECKKQQNPAGLFAVLYHRVTIRVWKGIQQGEFQNNPLMEKLDVIFANRYLEAYEQFQQKKLPSASWAEAFKGNQNNQHIVLQQLLTGMNAHINLDLGIAASETMKGQPINDLKANFFQINQVLADMIDDVKLNMNRISPVFKWLMPLAQKLDEKLVNFSIQTARDGAWNFAVQLHQHPNPTQAILDRDTDIAHLGSALLRPGKRLSVLLYSIRLMEWKSVSDKMTILST